MSARLDPILEKIDELSIEELWTIQERVINQLRTKTNGNSNGSVKTEESTLPTDYVQIPGAYQRTTEEVNTLLAKIFTPEELARMGKTDFSKLPQGTKSLSEVVNEDREDRV